MLLSDICTLLPACAFYTLGFELNFVQTRGVTVSLEITKPSARSAGSHSNLLPTAARRDPPRFLAWGISRAAPENKLRL